MIFIVILEPLVKLRHDGFCIGTIMDIDVIPLEGLDEGFGHTVGFRTSDGSKTTDETDIFSKRNGFRSRVAAAIVTKPFHGMGESGNRPEASLDRFNHQIPHHLAGNAPGGSNMADDFTVTAIQGKGNSHDLSIPAGNLKAIGTPARIGAQGNHLAFVRKLTP